MSEHDLRAAFDAAEALGGQGGQSCDQIARDNVQGPPDWAAPDVAAPEVEGAAFPLNDYGNGQRLMHYYGENIKFVPRLGWYRWGGKFWRADEDELHVRRDAQRIAQRILDEVEYLALEDWQRDALDLMHTTAADLRELEKLDHAKRDEAQKQRLGELRDIRAAGASVKEWFDKAKSNHRSHAKNTGNSGKISNMLAEARVEAATTVGALNADPLMVNCDNGVLKFSQAVDPHAAEWGAAKPRWRVDLLPHHRDHLISKMAQAEYDPAATCPRFEAFLEVVQPEPEMRAFLQRWLGYSITGLTSEQKLAFFYGGGRNGKSTLVDVIARLLADYGTSIPIETLTGTEQRKGSDATPDLVRLPGARFVRASEPEQGTRMKEALIKALTGGEPIMIRRMQQEFVEVVPEFKLTISGNHKPEIRGADDGIWRRVLLVLFGVQIPDGEVDGALPEKLWAERSGILAWLVRGCLDYLENGLQVPASVSEATEEYRKDSDPMRVFLTAECEVTGSPDDFERGRDLADAFNAWLLSAGESVWGKRTVANAIKARAGAMKGASGHVYTPAKRSDTGYIGIRMPPETLDRIAAYGDELRSGAARRG